MANYTITANEQFKSNEITFESKPDAGTITALKSLRFRWNPKKACWYGFADPETIKATLNGEKVIVPVKAKEPKKNKYGVKVGDYFSASWGYDQTNVDFFQVIALVGESSVRVREVRPELIAEDGYSHGMAADRTYKLDTSKMAPKSPFSTFITDQENGDLKRIKSHAADGVSNPYFYLSSFANAYKITGDTVKTYESWYA